MRGYRFSVRWIANNDEPTLLEIDEVAGLISVCLIADLFDKTPEIVARDVIAIRIKNWDKQVLSCPSC